MANYEDLLKKNKDRLSAIKQEPKKLDRKGIKRPWQENLSEVQIEKAQAPQNAIPSSVESEAKADEKQRLRKNKPSEAIIEHQKVSEQLRNSSETVTKQIIDSTILVTEQIRNTIEDESLSNEIKGNNGLELRNSSETVTELINVPSNYVTEQIRNNKGTDSGPSLPVRSPSPIEDVAQSPSVDSKLEENRSRVSEHLLRNSSVTIPEHEKRNQQYTNKLRTGTGTVPEQINVYAIPKSESRILGVLVNICVNTGKTITPPITYENLSELSNVPTESCKTLVKRLEKKGVLARIDGRRGPGAWTVFEIPVVTYQAFLSYSQRTINVAGGGLHFNNSGTNSGTSTGTNLRTDAPSSSSLNINTTSRTEVPELELWKDIVIPPFLASRGFSINHARQILSDKENKLSVEEVQESFDNFCADLENNKIRIQSTPIQFFMGVLRRRREKYESVFLSEQFEAELLAHQKQLQRSQDAIKAAKMEELAGKYEEWKKGLSIEEREQIAPTQSRFDDSNGVIQDRMLKAHFNKMNGLDD